MSAFDLPPDLRARLARLSLTPRRPAALGGAGSHPSRNRGGSMEFAQYRAYERGDDPRRIDWKLYARSDRVFVREAERESPIAVWLVIDASASMAQTDLARPGWSRLDAARRLAGAAIEIALRQGDRFGLVVARAEAPMILPPQGGARWRDRVRLTLDPLTASGIVDWARDAAVFAERMGPHDLVLILSDGFDEACIATAERLADAGRDVALIQILTGDERDFPFDGGYRFTDAETGADLIADGRMLKADFTARFAAARAALQARLAARGIRRVEHFIDKAADAPLRALSAAGGRR